MPLMAAAVLVVAKGSTCFAAQHIAARRSENFIGHRIRNRRGDELKQVVHLSLRLLELAHDRNLFELLVNGVNLGLDLLERLMFAVVLQVDGLFLQRF